MTFAPVPRGVFSGYPFGERLSAFGKTAPMMSTPVFNRQIFLGTAPVHLATKLRGRSFDSLILPRSSKVLSYVDTIEVSILEYDFEGN